MKKGNLSYLVISILGISFLFFLGFPFGNHNESYLWIAQFKNMDIFDVLTKQLQPVATFRPLGNLTAWITYKLSGGIWLQQLLNWLFVLIALVILFFSAASKSFFGFIAFLVTSAFFSGYIFLFHLHGVFYGPLLVYISILLSFSDRPSSRSQNVFLIFILTLLVALYHPFSLLVYAFFLVGYFFQHQKQLNHSHVIVFVLLFIVTILLQYLILQSRETLSITKMFHGILVTFRMVEVYTILSILAALLSFITIWTIPTTNIKRLVSVFVISALSGVFLYYNIPVLLLWICILSIQSIMQKRWILLSLMLSTLLFPAATATGSPSYSVFVLIASSYAMVYLFRFQQFERFLQRYYWLVRLFVTCCILLFFFIKTGNHIPVVSNIVNPILAEKEKTNQLEIIISWYQHSNFSSRRLQLFDSAENPSVASNAINRKHRPPTSQKYLDAYLGKCVSSLPESIPLVITFGDKYLQSRKILFSVPGRYNGTAIVFE
jgi:hypothetical protein